MTVTALLAGVTCTPPVVAQDILARGISTRVGLTPAQTRALYARVDLIRDQIDSLSQSNRIQSRTLRAIAIELGARNPNLSSSAFFDLITARAAEAANSKAKLDALSATIERLDPGGNRSRAASLLKVAHMAFDEGRLSDAETAFGQLSFLRNHENDEARGAWLQAVDLQAQSASLRGDTETATNIRLAKMEELRAARTAAEQEEWQTALDIAKDWQDRGKRTGDTQALLRSIQYYQDLVLALAPKDRFPYNWATTQNDLGNALGVLGTQTGKHNYLIQALSAYRRALEVWTHKAMPTGWAQAQNNLGNVLIQLAQGNSDRKYLEMAATAFRFALEERPRTRIAKDWAMTQSNLGNALLALANRTRNLATFQEALTAYRSALEELTLDKYPAEWADSQNNLGAALLALAEATDDDRMMEEALAVFRSTLRERHRDRVPLSWSNTQNNVAATLMKLGKLRKDRSLLVQAAATYELALEEVTAERAPRNYYLQKFNLGCVLYMLGKMERSIARFDGAIAAFEAALSVKSMQLSPLDTAWTQYNYGDALVARAGLTNMIGDYHAAAVAYRAAADGFDRNTVILLWGRARIALARARIFLAEARDPGANPDEIPILLAEARSVGRPSLDNSADEIEQRYRSLKREEK